MLSKDLVKGYIRGGVVPYQGTRYFFCVDSHFGELTDAGGGISPNEDPLPGCIRELAEETLALFDFRGDVEYVRENSIALVLGGGVIIFQPVMVCNPEALVREYRSRYADALCNMLDDKHVENSHILWIEEDDLRRLCDDEIVPLPAELAAASNLSHYPSLYYRLKNVLKLAFGSGALF